jgi:hypothetical protein
MLAGQPPETAVPFCLPALLAAWLPPTFLSCHHRGWRLPLSVVTGSALLTRFLTLIGSCRFNGAVRCVAARIETEG